MRPRGHDRFRPILGGDIIRKKSPFLTELDAMHTTLEQLGIDRLSPAERLELIGLIWDSISEAEPFSPPEWHVRELEKRRAAAEAEPGAGVPWEVVKARLTGKPE